MYKILISFLLCLFFNSLGYAKDIKTPLPGEKAFQFSTSFPKNNQLLLEWNLAPGYYLYRDRLFITLMPSSEIKFNKIQLPGGEIKKDEMGSRYEIYKNNVKIPVSLSAIKGSLNLEVNYQGCSEEGYCYPPEKKVLHFDLPAAQVTVSNLPLQTTQQNVVQGIFEDKSHFIIVLSFLGLGLLLAFTPCVLPMVPILSGIIIGHKRLTTAKAFFLSLAYVMGMAITYAVAGMIVAMLGSRVQTFFQSTAVIVFVSALFVLLALSLFGFYELALPKGLQGRLIGLSNRQKSGTYIGVFFMGVISSLIVSPCVSAPLVGVLAYIAQSGDIFLGGVALLALGIGMGIPLLLVGVSAGKLLPKAGSWMIFVERFFGILLLAVAIWMLSRVIPGPAALFLWALLLISTSLFMGVFSPAKNNWYNLLRALGLVLFTYGLILVIGAAMGNSDPLQPWEKVGFSSAKEESYMTTLTNMEQLNQVLLTAKEEQKPVMLDFYANWCSSCVVMERYVFKRKNVQEKLKDFVVLRADVTNNNDFDKKLLKRFQVIAPPTILFFNAEGREIEKGRIVGEVNKKEFLKHLELISQME